MFPKVLAVCLNYLSSLSPAVHSLSFWVFVYTPLPPGSPPCFPQVGTPPLSSPSPAYLNPLSGSGDSKLQRTRLFLSHLPQYRQSVASCLAHSKPSRNICGICGINSSDQSRSTKSTEPCLGGRDYISGPKEAGQNRPGVPGTASQDPGPHPGRDVSPEPSPLNFFLPTHSMIHS